MRRIHFAWFFFVFFVASAIANPNINGDTIIYDSNFANMTVYPNTAYSSNNNYEQTFEICNKVNQSGYLFLSYQFTDLLKSGKFSKLTKTIEELNVPIFNSDKTEILGYKLENYTKLTYDEVLNAISHLFSNQIHNYLTQQGIYLLPRQCITYRINYEPSSSINNKWNLRLWGNTVDDWSCVLSSTCLFDYLLDPLFVNLTNSVAGDWNFNSTLLDSVKLSNGTGTGSFAYITSPLDQAVNFTATGGQYVSLPDNAVIEPATFQDGNMTVVVWLKKTINEDGAIISKWNDGGAARTYMLKVNLYGKIRALLANNNAYSASYDCTSDQALSNNSYEMITFRTTNKNNITVFRNDTSICSQQAATVTIADNGQATIIGDDGGDLAGSTFVGSIDNLVIFNRALNDTEIIAMWNQSLVYPYYNIVTNIISFLYQTPSFITRRNLFNESYNSTYYVFSSNGINMSNVVLHYNVTRGDGTPCQYVNKTRFCGNKNESYVFNASSNFTFSLEGDEIYPATYNIDPEVMENTSHQNQSVGSNNDWVKLDLLNVTKTQRFSFFEIMINTTGLNDQPLYTCNESYVAGSPLTDNNCVLFAILPPQPYDHRHTVYSAHMLINYPITAAGNILGVGITNRMYFLLRGGTGWNFYYVTNITRTNGTQTSVNGGTTWTNFVGTIDAHLHQFGVNDTLNEYACFTDLTGIEACSSIRSQIIGVTSLPPTSPNVYNPVAGDYAKDNSTILINWTESESDINFIVNYTLIYLNGASNTIVTLAPTARGYDWNASLIANGSYRVRVTAIDNESLTAFGESDIFNLLANPEPPTPTNTGDAIIIAAELLAYILLVFVSVIAYFLSLIDLGKGASIVLKLIAIGMIGASFIYAPSTVFENITIAITCVQVFVTLLYILSVAKEK